MGVAVHKTGDGYHAGTIDDGGGLLLGCDLINIDDLAALDADKSTEQDPVPLVHGHGGYI